MKKDLHVVPKGWGHELFCFHNKEPFDIQVETIKTLNFDKGKKCSYHYHKNKEEYFVVLVGRFYIRLEHESFEWGPSDGPLLIPPRTLHQMTGLEEKNILLEVSTLDDPGDSYRVEKGD